MVAILLIFSLPMSNFINLGINELFKKFDIINKKEDLFIHFIDVGQGDAVAINLPNGEVALIDMGTQFSVNNYLNYIENYVMNNKKDKTIDYLFFTHADADHVGGLSLLLEKYRAKNIYRSRQYLESENVNDKFGALAEGVIAIDALNSVLNARDNGSNLITANDGMTLNIDNVEIKIFYPNAIYEDKNDLSYYIKLTYKGKSALFGGDASFEVESKIIENYGKEIDCDILKVSHHGSDDATSSDFLKFSTPEYAVISVGNNIYGHPTNNCLKRLADNGVKAIYRTDEHKTIVLNLKDCEFLLGDFTFINMNFSWGNIVFCAIVFILGNLIYIAYPEFKAIIIKKKKKL